MRDAGAEIEKLARMVLIYFDKPPGPKMGFNFADYMFMRRVNLAVKKCMINGQIMGKNIPCAMHILAPGRVLDSYEAKDFFAVQTLVDKRNYYGKQFLDIESLIFVGNLYYIFNEFELPHKDGKVSKQDFLNALENQVLPITLPHQFLGQLEDYLDPGDMSYLNFKSFSYIIQAVRQFNSYAKTLKGVLLKSEEFLSLLNDMNFDVEILYAIDSYKDVAPMMAGVVKDKKFQSQVTTQMKTSSISGSSSGSDSVSGTALGSASTPGVSDEDFLAFFQTNDKYRNKNQFKLKNKMKLKLKLKSSLKNKALLKAKAKVSARSKQTIPILQPTDPNIVNRKTAFTSFSF